MYEYVYDVYETIIANTDSVVIVFLVVMTLAVVLAIIPLYNLILKGRKAENKNSRERDQQLIEVIRENSGVLSALKVTLDNNGAHFGRALERVHERIDEQNRKINKVLVIVSGGSFKESSKVKHPGS